MFRSSTIIRDLALNLAEVVFTLKHSVKFRRYLLFGCVATCHAMAWVVCCAECNSVPFCTALCVSIISTRTLLPDM